MSRERAGRQREIEIEREVERRERRKEKEREGKRTNNKRHQGGVSAHQRTQQCVSSALHSPLLYKSVRTATCAAAP